MDSYDEKENSVQDLNVQQILEQKVIQSDNCVYTMDKKPHGYAAVFNQEKFLPDSNLEDRSCSHVDVEKLDTLFRSLDYIVEIFNDFTTQQIEDKINYYSKQIDHGNYDSFVCIFLSHGIYRYICGSDGAVDLEKIFAQFQGHECPTLAGKPKIFIIQACRGKKYDLGVDIVDSPHSEENNSAVDKFGYKLPSESDFLLAYATTNNYKAFRNMDLGSWFIQDLVTILTKYHSRMDLLRMLTRVNDLMARRESPGIGNDRKVRKQSPSIVCRLRRDVYFSPEAAIIGGAYYAKPSTTSSAQ